ncbi:MAG TPA: hypothetical protein DC023_01335 [Oceanospirillaceae bacterium]|nr:hypothetical protein [Oceanospirillaceae bacterium]
MLNNIEHPSQADIAKLDIYGPTFDAELSSEIKARMQQLDITPTQLNRRIPGISKSAWFANIQSTAPHSHALHNVAAFAWLSQSSCLAFLQRKQVLAQRPNLCHKTLESMIISSRLNEGLFQQFLQLLVDKMDTWGYNTKQDVVPLLDTIPIFNNEFLMPDKLDIYDFKADYYQSIAHQLQEFREEHQIDIDFMATVLNEPISRIEAFEDPNNPITIPAVTAMRLKLGFKVQDISIFAAKMHKYRAFYNYQQIKYAREEIMVALMQPLTPAQRQWAHDTLHTIVKYCCGITMITISGLHHLH